MSGFQSEMSRCTTLLNVYTVNTGKDKEEIMGFVNGLTKLTSDTSVWNPFS